MWRGWLGLLVLGIAAVDAHAHALSSAPDWLVPFVAVALSAIGALLALIAVFRRKINRQNSELKSQLAKLEEGESQLRLLGQLAHEGILLHQGGILRSANERFFAMFGYQTDELIGHNVLPLLLAPDSNQALQQLRPSANEQIVELNAIRKDGERFFCIAYVRQLEIDQELWVAISFRDVSLEKALARKLRHIQHQIAQIQDAIFLMDPVTSVVLDVNPAACELLGYDKAELIGMKALQISATASTYGQWKSRVVLIREQRANVSEGFIRSRQGVLIPVETSSALIEDEEGETLLSIVRDLRERRRAEDEQQRMQRELAQTRKMEALGQLTGGVAHDFNNILGIVLGYSELAQRAAEEGDLTEIPGYLQRVQDAGKRARDLVKQMLAFSRGSVTERKMQGLKPLLLDQLKLLRSTLPSSIELVLDLQDGLPDVEVDATQVYQLLMNLVINARDAMEGAGILRISLDQPQDLQVECSITHQLVQGDRWVRLTVADTGKGMSEPVKMRVFEPFFTTKEPGKGTGMGLAVVQSILKGLHCHLVLDSDVGCGTSIQVFFPIPSAARETRVEPVHAEAEAERGQGQVVLLVDDEPLLTEYLSELLHNWGYEVDAFTDSKEALIHFLASPERFDLLLTDQTMPGMLGRELIDQIRGVRPELPVILHCGYSESITEEEAEAEGIHYLWKPTEPAHLLTTVASVTAKQEAGF